MADDVRANSSEHPTARICSEWLQKIELAKKHKFDVFGQYALEASRFFDGPHDFMWKGEYAAGANGFLSSDGNAHLPTFRMTVNKPFEAVALFGPALMHKYPNVMVTPVTPPSYPPDVLGLDAQDPLMAQVYAQYVQTEQATASQRYSHAQLSEHYLNWLQRVTDKKQSSRMAITEAIVKGLGVLYTQVHQPRGASIRYPRSRFLSCDDIQKDPDAEYPEDITWIAIRHYNALNRVAEKYGIPEKDLRGSMQSLEAQATKRGQSDARSKRGVDASGTYDLIEYWEIYSKNGFGHRLKTKNPRSSEYDFDQFGDFCYLVVAKNMPYPLNMPSAALKEEDFDSLFERASWPVPYWTDEGVGNGWPISELYFYDKMNCIWPLSMIKPVIGEIRFVNWCMSFLADKTAASATTYVAKAKSAGVEIQDQLLQGLAPYTVLEVSDLLGKGINDVVDFLQAPTFSIDIWKMVAEVMEMIDKRTGLTELIYGITGVQLRSARESEIKNQNTSIRPDDMAEKTEEFYSQTAMKEMEAAVWSLTGQDVQGVLGPAGASVFERQMQTVEFESVVRDYSYRIEAGSARKPNKENRLRTLNEWGQSALPVIQEFAVQGMTGPWNAYMSEVGRAMDFDASAFIVEPFTPPQEGEQENGNEEERKEEAHEQRIVQNEEKMEMAKEKHEETIKSLRQRRQIAGRNGNKAHARA